MQRPERRSRYVDYSVQVQFHPKLEKCNIYFCSQLPPTRVPGMTKFGSISSNLIRKLETVTDYSSRTQHCSFSKVSQTNQYIHAVNLLK